MTGNSDDTSGALRLYFDVLACVARADRRIATEERTTLLSAAAACELDAAALARLEERLDLARPFDIDDALSAAAGALSDPGVIVEIVRDAHVLAGSDAEVAPVELEVIDRFLARAGYDEAGRTILMEWGRRAAEVHIDGLRFAVELHRT